MSTLDAVRWHGGFATQLSDGRWIGADGRLLRDGLEPIDTDAIAALLKTGRLKRVGKARVCIDDNVRLAPSGITE